jgi:hypothetical protein
MAYAVGSARAHSAWSFYLLTAAMAESAGFLASRRAWSPSCSALRVTANFYRRNYMKLFRYASTAALSVLMAGVLVAQSSPQTPPARPADQAATPRAAQPAAQPTDAADITIVGCLAQAEDAAGGYTLTVAPAAGVAQAASAAAGAAADAARASAASGSARDAARAANAAGAPAAAAAEYKIVGIAADELKPHVNQQVELKGRVNAAAAAGAAQASAAKEFRASSVKMLNATCPPAK